MAVVPGVDATIARLNVRAADARTSQRRADLLPTINGVASVIDAFEPSGEPDMDRAEYEEHAF